MNAESIWRVEPFTVEYEIVVGLENSIYCGQLTSSVKGMVSVSVDCALVVTGRSTFSVELSMRRLASLEVAWCF